MKTWVAIIFVIVVIFTLVLCALSAAAVFSSQIVSSDFQHNGKGFYESPEINLLFKSQGSIQWGPVANGTSFYLVPASQMSKVNQSNIASLSYTPIKYAGGPDTYTYLGLTGSFYVVAISGTNPSEFASYQFSHSTYTGGDYVTGPQNFNQASDIFFGSISALILLFIFAVSGPIKRKVIDIHHNGDSVHKFVYGSLRKGSGKFISRVSKRKGLTVIIVVIVVFSMFSLVQFETRPIVVPVIPMASVSSQNITGNYTDNLSFDLLSPGITSSYYATLNGPIPQEGGINSTQLYSWAYSLQVSKVNESSKIFGLSQAPVIKNITVTIGKYNLQFNLNSYDLNYVYYNEVSSNSPSGTPNTGTQFAVYVSLTNEISAKIPDGNYTMHVELQILPQSVFGPYHFAGSLKTLSLSYPVYVNNSNVLDYPD